MEIKYLNKLSQVKQIPPKERKKLEAVEKKYCFRTNTYYLSLINWDDPDDPIRKIAIPSTDELQSWGKVDASQESKYTKHRGLQHKYPDTALFLVTNVCGTYCRFCFRKRLFFPDNVETIRKDIGDGIEYIKNHPEITNVLLTGGDPLIVSTNKLEHIISELRKIEHIKIVRIGTKIPASNPYRILDDPELLEMIKKYSYPDKRIYIITQFNHPRELTDVAIEALEKLHSAGAILANQTPLMRGINSDPEILAELLQKLSFVGNPPYYVFQVRPTVGNKPFALPLVQSYKIFQKAIMNVSGLAKRAKLVMSHYTGKIEIVGVYDGRIVFRRHRTANRKEESEIMIYDVPKDRDVYWLDDLDEPVYIKKPDTIEID